MVTFDASQTGTLAAVWDQDERLRALPGFSLHGVAQLIVVAAHPDDESLGVGGLMGVAAARGIPIQVLVVTDGAASHPRSPTHTPAQLVALRQSEASTAIAVLAPRATVSFLDLPDGSIRDSTDMIADRIRALVAEGAASLIVAPWRGDGHGDHRVTGAAAAQAAASSGARLAEYPVWMWHWATPTDPAVPWHRLRSVPLTPLLSEKKAMALAAYSSQVDGLSSEAGDGPMLRADFLDHFTRDREVLIEQPLPPSRHYFDEMYARRADPWSFETRWYEQRKRAVTLASLPAERYASALEIGCSIGLLTQGLADRCDRLEAVDISTTAVAAARRRLGDRENIHLAQADVTRDFPGGTFDLIVLSEVGYYFDVDGLASVLDDIDSSLGASGTLVVCHWRHPVADYPLSGDQVHEIVRAWPTWKTIVEHSERDFTLEVLSRDPRSVAERTGLA